MEFNFNQLDEERRKGRLTFIVVDLLGFEGSIQHNIVVGDGTYEFHSLH